MSSPATIPRAFINMSSSPIIDLTISPMSVRRTQAVEVVFISDTEDETNDPPPRNRNNSNFHLNDNNNNHNSTLGFDNQNIFNSSTRQSNNNQDSSNNSNNYNLRSGLAGLGANSSNGGGPIRNTSTRSSRTQSTSAIRGLLNFMLNVTVSSQANNNNHRQHHTSAFHPYEIPYGNNSSGSSRTIPPVASFFEPTRTNTNINNNDLQILNTPPSSSRRRTNNSPKPTTLVGHARDLNDSHTLVCADCNELLHEKLWALSSCGHVVCGSCVDKYLEKKKFHCPSCKKTTKPTTLLQLYV